MGRGKLERQRQGLRTEVGRKREGGKKKIEKLRTITTGSSRNSKGKRGRGE